MRNNAHGDSYIHSLLLSCHLLDRRRLGDEQVGVDGLEDVVVVGFLEDIAQPSTVRTGANCGRLHYEPQCIFHPKTHPNFDSKNLEMINKKALHPLRCKAFTRSTYICHLTITFFPSMILMPFCRTDRRCPCKL